MKRAAAPLLLAAITCALLASSRAPAQEADGGPSSPAVTLSEGVKKDGFDLDPQEVNVKDWPVVRLGFNIKREDKTPFRELKAGDIKVYVDGFAEPIRVGADDLKPVGNEPHNYLFMLDASLSMLPQEGTADSSSKINKFQAAKNALNTFIDRMRPGDKAAIAVFGPTPIPVAGLTSDQKSLKESVKGLKTQRGGTALYVSIKSAIEQARRDGIRDIVILSDGVDMSFTAEGDGYYPSGEGGGYYPSDTEKRRQEAEIVKSALNAGVRVFTIAIGDKEPGPRYVDVTSLGDISRQANGGDCYFVPLTQLEQQAAHDEATFDRLVVGELTGSLNAIQQASRFTYSLTLDLRPFIKPGAEPRDVTVEGAVESAGEKTVLTWKQDLNRSQHGDVIPGKAEVSKKRYLIPPPTRKSTKGDLSQIYLSIFVTLACITPLPLIGRGVARRVRVRTEARRARKAVGVIGDGSPLIGENCPNESRSRRYTFKQGDVILRCPKCKTTFHLDCWLDNHCTCTVHDCRRVLAVPAHILSQYGFDEERGPEQHERQEIESEQHERQD